MRQISKAVRDTRMQQRRHALLGVVVIAATSLAGCASEPAPKQGTGAEWERTQCAKFDDEGERARCIERTGIGYDEYVRQQKEAAKAGK